TDRYAIRLMQHSTLERKLTKNGWEVLIWRRPEREDGTATHLVLALSKAKTADPSGDQEATISNFQVPGVELQNAQVVSSLERGRIGELPFFRVEFRAETKHTALPMQGVAFLGYEGSTLITLVAMDRPANKHDTLLLAETAAVTFQPR